MLVGRCSSELSGHRLQGELKKSQPPSAAVFLLVGMRRSFTDHIANFQPALL